MFRSTVLGGSNVHAWLVCCVSTVITLGAGCGGGRSALDPATTQPNTPGAGMDASSTTSPATPLITNCDSLSWKPVAIGSVADVPARLAGQWTKCGGAEPVNMQSPFEMTADGHWYLLARAQDGSLQRLTGSGQAGTYKVPTSDSLVIGWNNAPPQSTLESNIAFMDQPRLMQWGPALYSITR
jgi:hypothetical protein